MKPVIRLIFVWAAALSSACGGAVGTKCAGTDASGEIAASARTAVTRTEAGDVAGYAQGDLFIFKGDRKSVV